MHRWLASLSAALVALSAQAADYVYVGGTYTAATITNNSTCGATQQCGQFNTSQRITGYFSTAAPLAPNLSEVNIQPLLTGYAFSNSVISIAMGDAAARAHTFRVTTDASGHITNASIALERWTDPVNAPHAVGARFNFIGISSVGDGSNINTYCTDPATTSADGTPDVCDAPGTDSATSSANGGSGAAWIPNPPTISIGDASITEGNAGATNLTFTVSLSSTPTAPVSARWATANGTATAGTDYTASSGTLSWAAGESTTKTVTVQIHGDTTVEPNENFYVTLDTITGAMPGTTTGTGTITNDDAATPSTPGDPVPVPALSTWGLLSMSALLGLEAVRRRRRKG